MVRVIDHIHIRRLRPRRTVKGPPLDEVGDMRRTAPGLIVHAPVDDGRGLDASGPDRGTRRLRKYGRGAHGQSQSKKQRAKSRNSPALCSKLSALQALSALAAKGAELSALSA